MNFTPEQMAKSIVGYIPGFKISYAPDFRQEIADSWPSSIDDAEARNEWGWEPRFNLDQTTKEMLENLKG